MLLGQKALGAGSEVRRVSFSVTSAELVGAPAEAAGGKIESIKASVDARQLRHSLAQAALRPSRWSEALVNA